MYKFTNLNDFELRLHASKNGTGEFPFVADPIPSEVMEVINNAMEIGDDDAHFVVWCDVSGEEPTCKYFVISGTHEIEVSGLFDCSENAKLFGRDVLLAIPYFV